MIIHILRYFS